MLTTCAVVYWRPWYQRYKAENQQLAKASHYEVSMRTDSYKVPLLNIIRAKAYAYTSNTAVNTITPILVLCHGLFKFIVEFFNRGQNFNIIMLIDGL